ncbi:MAG: hypothetical protein ACD_78C00289G0002 [uncultured bacterium (gcode 4)]|uniref:Uncharacterized protein n=1 Tax=uncultured bacterium (gcode 4) TaxID=1234023 RepID=K1YWT4_9BACT|nr:MAG: hypothetical protein ACD_78C00289G0002 [uncultured bacterium (gcode 4)]
MESLEVIFLILHLLSGTRECVFIFHVLVVLNSCEEKSECNREYEDKEGRYIPWSLRTFHIFLSGVHKS